MNVTIKFIEEKAMFAKRYARFYDSLNSRKPYKQEVEFVYGWAGRPKSIFDVGCGTASYWKYYPHGTYIVGIDKSPSMAGCNMNVIVGDITTDRIAGSYDCVTALFDVLNYIPNFRWWRFLPVKKGGFFVFDIWDKEKVDKDGFSVTKVKHGNMVRTIEPMSYDGRMVTLRVSLEDVTDQILSVEIHKMYVHSLRDIEKACGRFRIEEVKKTEKWQTWYKLIRK